MQKSKFWLLSLLLILAMGLVACGGGEEPAAEETEPVAEDTTTEEEVVEEEPMEEPMEEEAAEGDCTSEETFCVGLVTDVGEIDDKSFNQSAWEGALRAEAELGAQVDYIETVDAKDYGANIALFADAGYDVIVTVGFALGDATVEAALAYPEINLNKNMKKNSVEYGKCSIPINSTNVKGTKTDWFFFFFIREKAFYILIGTKSKI